MRPALLLRPLIMEFSPLAVFFAVLEWKGILPATGAYMGMTALVVGYGMTGDRKVPTLPLLSVGLVLAFGTLTLAMKEEVFILIHPTVANGFFGVVFLASMAFDRPLLQRMLAHHVQMAEPGWRVLTRRVGLYLIALAVLNEILWRNFSVETWAIVRLIVSLPGNALFILWQLRLLRRFRAEAGEGS